MTGPERRRRRGPAELAARWVTRRVAKRVTAAAAGVVLAGGGGWGAAEATDIDQPCTTHDIDHD